MAADLAQVEAAFMKAHAAGDAPAAAVLAAEVKRLRDFAGVKKEGVVVPPKFTPSGEKNLPQGVFDTDPESIAGNPLTRFALGAASPFLGLGQLTAHALGTGEGFDAKLKQLEDMKREGRSRIGSEGFDWTEGAGTLMSPAWRALPGPKADSSLLARTGGTAAQGAVAGAVTPVTDGGKDFFAEKGAQIGAGGVVGGLIPPVAAAANRGGKMVYHGLIEPQFEAGRTAIKGRAYAEAAGDKADEIIDLLTKNKQIVAGSHPSAGEAASPAGRAEFSALQASAEKVRPSDYLARSDQQNAARVEAIREFAGNPAKRAAAAAEREAAAGPEYARGAGQVSIDTGGLQDLLKRPSTNWVWKEAVNLAKERGGNFEPLLTKEFSRSMTGEEAQTLKLAFDDLIRATTKSAHDSAKLEAIKETRSAYVAWMEKEFEGLRAARATYKEKSAPINQMDVGEALDQRLTPALREDAKLRSTAFGSAVRESESLLKKSTGEPRFQKLEDVLTGRQLQSVHNVVDDLARSDRHADMARRGSQAANALDMATQNLYRETGGPLPNMLNRGVMLANAIIARMEGKVNRQMASEMAAEMLNPPKVGEALTAAKLRESRNAFIAEQIRRTQKPAVVGGASAIARQGDQ